LALTVSAFFSSSGLPAVLDSVFLVSMMRAVNEFSMDANVMGAAVLHSFLDGVLASGNAMLAVLLALNSVRVRACSFGESGDGGRVGVAPVKKVATGLKSKTAVWTGLVISRDIRDANTTLIPLVLELNS
jgi:hypothetical protein